MHRAYLTPKIVLWLSSFNPPTLAPSGLTWVGGPVTDIDGPIGVARIAGPPPIVERARLVND